MTKVIIDTDPGTDDALALTMALNEPTLEILGLSTVGGNASLAHTTRNALGLLEYMGRSEIPVFRGAARPLRGRFAYGYYYHGPTGLTVRLPSPKSQPKALRAPDYIVSMARSLPGELVVLALGPLTNVARAMNREPRLKDWIKGLVVMGGAVAVPGNVTAHAEFNIYNDPAAADLVFSSGVPLTLVGLDVCDQVYVGRDNGAWPEGQSRSEVLARKILTHWLAAHGESERYNLCDPLALVALLRPDLLACKQAKVAVETEIEERLGATAASYGKGNVKVATDVRVTEAKETIRDLLTGPVS